MAAAAGKLSPAMLQKILSGMPEARACKRGKTPGEQVQ